MLRSAIVLVLAAVVLVPLPQDTRKLPPPGPILGEVRTGDIRFFTDPRPATTVSDVFARWADATIRVLCERFEVPAPHWELHGQAPSLDCTAARIYDPATATIRVYERQPSGAPFTLDMMRYVFLHGFLHHLHKVRGMTHLPGHDVEFDRWMRVLGLWRAK